MKLRLSIALFNLTVGVPQILAWAFLGWPVFSLVSGCFSAAVGLISLGSMTPQGWHWLFHMKEPCLACGHTRRHNVSVGHKRLCGHINNEPHCFCSRREMEEANGNRTADQGGNGSAGAPTNPQLPASYGNTFVIPKLNSLTVPSPSSYLTPAYLQSILGISANPVPSPRALPTEAWSGQVYRGWRAFRLIADSNALKFRLASMNGVTWEDGELTAECTRPRYDPIMMLERPPTGPFAEHAPKCTCGIYIWNDKRTAMMQMMNEGGEYVIGECVGWGTVIEAEKGYRVEHCRIEGLWTLDGGEEKAAYLSQTYGVPVRNLWDALNAL